MRTYRVLLSGEPILLVEGEPDFGRFEAISDSYLKPAPEVGSIRATVLPDIGKTTAREVQHVTIINSLDSHFVGDTGFRAGIDSIESLDKQWFEVRVEGDSRQFWLLNFLGDLVPLDRDKAVLRVGARSGALIEIDGYAFDSKDLAGRTLFRTDARSHLVHCTDAFRDLALERGWHGLGFVPTWDSELEPFRHTPRREDVPARPEVYGPDGFHRGAKRFWPEEWKAD